MHVVGRLAELNEVDLAIDVAKARLAEIAEALKEPAVVREARQELAQAETALAHGQTRLLDRELAQQQAAERLARAQAHLYSGRVTVSKELENLQAELEQLRRQLGQAEDELLEALVEVEAATERSAAAQQALARLVSETAHTQEQLRAEQQRLIQRLAAQEARHAVIRERIPADLLRLYETLRPRRGGRAVAELDGDTCSACRVAVSPSKVELARYGDELVYCENCGRLLWGE